jgi:glycine hydroxymethyltransferase
MYTSALNPGGVRLGTPALTTRGLSEEDFDKVAEFLHRGSVLALQAQEIAQAELKKQQEGGDEAAKKKVLIKDFVSVLETNQVVRKGIDDLRAGVNSFAIGFNMPTDDDDDLEKGRIKIETEHRYEH